MQGSLFALLDYAIGGGRQDVTISLGWRTTRLDMLFSLPNDFKLVVEYDGAYWHRGREEQDFAKSRNVMLRYARCLAVRVREYPLEATCDGDLVAPDVQVPARVDAATCARLVLLHLVHEMPTNVLDYAALDRVLGFLRSAPLPLEHSSVLCEACRDVVRHFNVPTTTALSAGNAGRAR
jgi:hypothetical protein